jgi:predicted transcriptional regulator
MTNPTPSELEVLNILWEHKEANTQTVNAQLNLQRPLDNPVGYTSTLKTMQVMVEKGLLDRRKEGKSHVYFPLIQESIAKGNLLTKFVNNTFGGSNSNLVMQLLGNKNVSQDEITQIKRFLKDIEDKNHG